MCKWRKRNESEREERKKHKSHGPWCEGTWVKSERKQKRMIKMKKKEREQVSRNRREGQNSVRE